MEMKNSYPDKIEYDTNKYTELIKDTVELISSCDDMYSLNIFCDMLDKWVRNLKLSKTTEIVLKDGRGKSLSKM